MQQTFVMDSRLPISTTLPETDPSHPKNVMRTALNVQNQAAADTKYDIYPPPRVENFAVSQKQASLIYLFGALFTMIITLALLLRVQMLFARIALIVLFVYATHYVVGRLGV